MCAMNKGPAARMGPPDPPTGRFRLRCSTTARGEHNTFQWGFQLFAEAVVSGNEHGCPVCRQNLIFPRFRIFEFLSLNVF